MSRYARPKTPKGTKNPRIVVVREHEGRRVASLNALKVPGDFCIFQRTEDPKITTVFEIAFILPGHAKASSIIVQKVENVVSAAQAADHVWNWDGNEEAPTVNPKIDSTDLGKRWLGYLIGGKFVAV